LPREEWAEGPGEESRPDGVAAQAIEAQPVFGQIKPSRGQARPRAEQHRQEKTLRTSNLHKRLGLSGEEKEILAFRKDNITTRQSVRTATPPMERVSVGPDAPANPSAQTKALAFLVTWTSLIHRTEIPPLRR
jgi:hypothetical protein